MGDRPERLMTRRNIEHADPSMVGIGYEKRFVEEKFVDTTRQNTDRNEENQTTSDARLFEPVSVQNEGGVEPFDGHQGREPEDHSAGRQEKIVQQFTKNVIDHRCRTVRGDVENDVDETTDEKAEIDLIDDAQPEKVVTDAVAAARSSMECHEGEEIVRDGQEKTEQGE